MFFVVYTHHLRPIESCAILIETMQRKRICALRCPICHQPMCNLVFTGFSCFFFLCLANVRRSTQRAKKTSNRLLEIVLLTFASTGCRGFIQRTIVDRQMSLRAFVSHIGGPINLAGGWLAQWKCEVCTAVNYPADKPPKFCFANDLWMRCFDGRASALMISILIIST